MTLRTLEETRELTEQRAQNRGNSNSSSRTNFLKWKDKETKSVRFLSDGDQIFFKWVHDFVPCQDGKNRSFVCAEDSEDESRPCELCQADVKRRELGYAVALVREEVRDAKNKIVGYDTVMVENEDGDLEPLIGIVSQGWNNFWTFVDSYYMKYGSLLDLDLDITRKGADMTTIYSVMPNQPDPIDGLATMFGDLVPDHKAIIENMGSEAYYAQHLHGIKKESSSNNDEEQSKQDQYSALKERLGRK
jgi:hypothetical protein